MNGTTVHKKIPFLLHVNTKIFNDKEKAELFAQLQAKIFTPYNDNTFDNEHKSMIPITYSVIKIFFLIFCIVMKFLSNI